MSDNIFNQFKGITTDALKQKTKNKHTNSIEEAQAKESVKQSENRTLIGQFVVWWLIITLSLFTVMV